MSLQLIPLSDETIAKHNYQICDLWMVKNGQDILGPFHTSQIKEEVAKKNEILDQCDAYNLESEQWQPVYQWPIFQRRVPQLVPLVELVTDTTFFVLVNGHKDGPYHLEQIEQGLESGKFNSNDLITNTEGHAWIKICEHDHFDRRKKEQKPLPGKPVQDVFEQDDQKVVSLITKKQAEKEEEDALVGLAFIVNGNDKGQTIDQNKPATPKKSVMAASESGQKSWNWKWSWDFNWSHFRNLKENKTLIFSSASIGIILLFFTVMNSINSSFDTGHDIKFVRTKEKKDIRLPNPKTLRKPASTNTSKVHKSKMQRLKPVPRQRLVKKAERPNTAPKDVERDEREDNYRDDYPEDRYPYEEEPIVHYYDSSQEAVTLDVNDPAVREEISRELASDLEDEHMTDQERRAIEREIRNEIDNEAERYLEERADQYEQVSDFE